MICQVRPERSSANQIHIGGVFASREPAVVRTLLGSCIAVCLRDPRTRVGGMNHFLLPYSGADEAVSTRYGVHAMELLINECMKAGADRCHLEAKVFGGGHVLRMAASVIDVPTANIRFALEFLDTESIPIRSQDIGGIHPREVYFHTDTGKVLLRRLKPTEIGRDVLTNLKKAELKNVAPPPTVQDDSNVTLF